MDVLKYLKGVQHPVRGLMLRYYFLKILKDKIEDRESELDLFEIIRLFL